VSVGTADAVWITGGVAGTAVVAGLVGVKPVFGIVVQAEAQASRITSTAKRNECRWNLMMLNSKETFIFVTIPIRSVFCCAVLFPALSDCGG